MLIGMVCVYQVYIAGIHLAKRPTSAGGTGLDTNLSGSFHREMSRKKMNEIERGARIEQTRRLYFDNALSILDEYRYARYLSMSNMTRLRFSALLNECHYAGRYLFTPRPRSLVI